MAQAQAILDDRGQQVRLGSQVARGGEGTIHEIVGQPDFLAKIYILPMSNERSAKIAAMAGASTTELARLCAWPKSLLRQAGRPVGLVMPRFDGRKELHVLHGPKSRKAAFPHAGFDFLVLVALNLARSVASLHARGIVIGDVNERGFLVSGDGTVRLIDCDSFQVNVGGRTYPCDVGIAEYTPPELQGGSLAQLIRSEQHDCFGLAVLIFKLLFMGRHPFAGVFTGGTKELHEAIAECRYAYSADVARTRMKPPPRMLTVVEGAGQAIDALFEVAFSPQALPTAQRVVGRPSAGQWVESLSALRSQFTDCSFNLTHKFVKSHASCPWCEIENRFGVDIFNFVPPKGAPTIDVEAIWTALQALRVPQPPVLLPETFVKARPPPLPEDLVSLRSRLTNLEDEIERFRENDRRLTEAHTRSRVAHKALVVGLSAASGRVQHLAKWHARLERAAPTLRPLILIYCIGGLLLGMAAALSSLALLVVAACILIFPSIRLWTSRRIATMLGNARASYIRDRPGLLAQVETSSAAVGSASEAAERSAILTRQVATAAAQARAEFTAERDRRMADKQLSLDAAQLKANASKQALANIAAEAGILQRDIVDRRKQLQTVRARLSSLTDDRNKALRDLRKADRAGQLHQHLDRQYVQTAKIQGITPALKSALASFGIETAADVNEPGVSNVPGFGTVRTGRMIEWRKSMTKTFVYKPNSALDPAAVAKIDATFSLGTIRAAKEFTAAHNELDRRIRQHVERAASVKSTADNAVRALAEARAAAVSLSSM